MAVAVKSNRDTSTPSLFDRLPVNILLGVLYVLGSLGIVFPLLHVVWWTWLRLPASSLPAWAGLVVVGATVAVGLLYLGHRLLGPHPPKGLISGIVLGTIGVLLAGLLAVWIGNLVESWLYASNSLGNMAWSVGAGVTAGLAVLMLVGLVRLFTNKNAEKWLATVEEQGWFTPTFYKRSQGLRVRRGTMLGILIVAAAGIYSLYESIGPKSYWELDVPFTGKVAVTPATAGDNPALRQMVEASASGIAWIDRFQLRDQNKAFQTQYVKITDPGDDPYDDVEPKTKTDWKPGDVVEKSRVNDLTEQRKAKRDKLKKAQDDGSPEGDPTLVVPPKTADVEPAAGEVSYANVLLLPHLKYTLTLLLGALSLWVGWRVVNWPAFADFLIATEAELNKVSWTSRKRLVQDTMVVLVTVVLMAAFLFVADRVWSGALTWIGVLQPPPPEASSADKPQPW
jgi:preprotein translocase SecE subunit